MAGFDERSAAVCRPPAELVPGSRDPAAGGTRVLEVTCGACPDVGSAKTAAGALECRAVRIWAVAIVVAGMGSGCKFGPYTFVCTNNAACGVAGICEGNGFCSFPDSTCLSGRRFGDLGGPSAGQCVDSQSDGSLSDAGPFCYGSGPYSPICFAAPPTGTLTVSMSTPFNTDAGALMGTPCARPISGGRGDCVIAANTIIISTPLRAIGMQPLVLVAADSISVLMSGSIDVGSYRRPTESLGAGADPSSCNAGTPPGTSGGTNATGGGGAGGSFMGAGGRGGPGGGGGLGGMPGTLPGMDTIHGGCPAQDGAGVGQGARGHGGGAVFLIAGKSITIGGPIMAGGEGGDGAAREFSGGGGGGAGGMIGLDARVITVDLTTVNPTAVNLIANGGGGGGAADLNAPGESGEDSTSTNAARGGSGAVGGNGGNGSAGVAGGPGAMGLKDNVGGGGGGGGGAGLILIEAPMGANLTGANVSPVPTTR